MKVEFELIGWFPALIKKWKPRKIENDNDFLRAVVESYLIDKETEEQNQLASVGVKQKPIQSYERKYKSEKQDM